jgi:hypothetical protein
MSMASSSLRSFLRPRTRTAPAALDPADMGTCFGLEMTLSAPALEPVPRSAPARPWWQRLGTRKPATA